MRLQTHYLEQTWLYLQRDLEVVPGSDKTIMIDLDGAEKMDVQQFIMVRTIHADEPEYWTEEGMIPYFIAKHYADRIIKESSLNFTIVMGVTSKKGNKFNTNMKYEKNRIMNISVGKWNLIKIDYK